MGADLRLLKFEDIKQDLVVFFKRRSLIPIVGAGVSSGSQAYNGTIPSGSEYMQHMLEELEANNSFSDDDRKELRKANFSTLCDYYEDDAHVAPAMRLLYLKNNFFNALLEDIRRCLFEIDWPYVYSLNIDDAIERSSEYKTIILPKREFRDEVFVENKCLIKLHGDIGELIKYEDGSKIFTSKEYALSLEQNAPLLNKLRNDYANQNVIFIGCSLDDEIDLKSLSLVPVDFTAKDSLRKTLLFMKGSPSKLQISRYKTYGVTDVVSFDDYTSMYKAIIKAWEESQCIKESEIENYETIRVRNLKSIEKAENHSYFFWGKGLLDPKSLEMSYPYYFISRDIAADIVGNLGKNKIHLIKGSRISGKSYLLAGLYKEIVDRRVCYFDGKSRLSEVALQRLIGYKNSVILLDNGALSREQFETVLESAETIHKNSCNFIICVNDNDSDTYGIINYKLEKGVIDNTDILNYSIKSRFNCTETNEINQRFPAINLPPYSVSRTILDQHIYAERELGAKSQFERVRIKVSQHKELALLIVLAIKEKMSSLDVINLGLDQEISEAVKKYDPFIERVETFDYEKDGGDLSSLKYVLNSKYWLKRELGHYAQNEENYAIIADAFQYIIRKVTAAAGANKYRRRKLCKSYIMFDVMNDIFLNQYGGSIKLIVHIYNKLHELLATDYNFLHQNAKCLMNYYYTLKEGDKDNKSSCLEKAKDLAVVSKTMIEHLYEESSNERLLISIAHVHFTIASIQSNLCKFHEYSNAGEIEDTIDIVDKALEFSYNNEYQQEGQRSSKSIFDFVQTVYENLDSLSLSNSKSRKVRDMMALITYGIHGKRKR